MFAAKYSPNKQNLQQGIPHTNNIRIKIFSSKTVFTVRYSPHEQYSQQGFPLINNIYSEVFPK
jgi:hypothetical protein